MIELLQMIELELLQMIELGVSDVVMPPVVTRSPEIDTTGRPAKSFETKCAAAKTFRLPAPPVSRPAAGMNELVNCMTA